MKKDGLSDDEETILDNSKSDLSYVLKTIVDEQVKIKPLITVKQGSKIFINPTVDIWFPKPKNNTGVNIIHSELIENLPDEDLLQNTIVTEKIIYQEM